MLLCSCVAVTVVVAVAVVELTGVDGFVAERGVEVGSLRLGQDGVGGCHGNRSTSLVQDHLTVRGPETCGQTDLGPQPVQRDPLRLKRVQDKQIWFDRSRV